MLQTNSDIAVTERANLSQGMPTGILVNPQGSVFNTASTNYNPQEAAIAADQQQQIIDANKRPVFKSRFTGQESKA